MRFLDLLGRTERSELTQMEAAELLGVCERTFRRWRDRHREDDETGLLDLRLRPSPRRAPVREIERMLGLYRELYRGFTVKHFHEQLGKRHNYTLGASQETATASDGGNDAASGRLDARPGRRTCRANGISLRRSS
jgi:hypothetical protein